MKEQIEEEIWKDVVDYEGIYQVSDQGRVKSLRTGQERLMAPKKSGKGYLQVNLYKDKKKKTVYIHRLVAQAFLPNPENLPQVNHCDEDKTNNFVGNLEWCSASYNINHGTRNARVIATNNGRKTCQAEQPVVATRNGTEQWYKSQIEAARQLGLRVGNIHHCIVGRQHQTGGWTFRRAGDRPAVESLF